MTWGLDRCVVSLSTEHDIRVNKGEKGAFVNMTVVTFNEDGKGQKSYWDAAVWVPNEKLQQFTENLIKGKNYWIRNAYIERKFLNQDSKYPITQVRIKFGDIWPWPTNGSVTAKEK